jgi:predicted RNase H-like nuclease (RuvC/YqgF family)
MKNSLFTFAIAATLMAGITLTGCQSAAQKSEDAQTDVIDAREDLQEEQQEAAAAAQEAANEQEWQAFKSDAEMKIKEHEDRIVELKAKMKKSGKTMDAIYAKNVENLEQKIKDMKTRMEARNNSESDWETFKREFNSDMEGLGKAFNNLAVDNKD